MPSVPDQVTNVYRSNSTTYNYHSPWVNASTASKAVDRIGDYNMFKPKYVKDAIRSITASYPSVKYSVGREGSPVLYISTYAPRAIIGVLTAMDDDYAPDEVGRITGKPNAQRYLDRLEKKRSGASVVRAWWD